MPQNTSLAGADAYTSKKPTAPVAADRPSPAAADQPSQNVTATTAPNKAAGTVADKADTHASESAKTRPPTHQAPNSLAAADQAIQSSRAHTDPDYPRFHVAPTVGRLNDPNGLILKDGEYHVFHQLGPFFPDRKAIYWGHCSSTDLVNWHQHAPALAPNDWFDKNGVYSGGAIAAGDEVWLHYTGNVKADDGKRSAYQCAATTTDFNEFTKLDVNPLISTPIAGYTAHVRDPFVVGSQGDYTMYLGAQREDLTGTLLVYKSPDLRSWEMAGELVVDHPQYDDFGYMWECPNVMEMTDEATGETLDVLLFSPQGIPAQEHQFRNIFACGYLVGHMDGTTFTPTSDFIEFDSGFEFYAPQVFTLPADSRRPPLLMGWVGNASEDDQPSLRDYGWVHVLSTARELRLRNGRVYQTPLFHDLGEGEGAVVSVAADANAGEGEGDPFAAGTPRFRDLEIAGSDLAGKTHAIAELQDERSFVLDLNVAQSGPWRLTLGKADGPRVDVLFEDGQMVVDRSTTHYPHGDRRVVPVPAGERVDVQVVHDRSVTEIFVGSGHTAFSMRSYLDADVFAVTISGNAKVEAAKAVIL